MDLSLAKSLVFLILFVVGSYANEFSHATTTSNRVGDRKLFGFFSGFGKLGSKGKNSLPHTPHNIPKFEFDSSSTRSKEEFVPSLPRTKDIPKVELGAGSADIPSDVSEFIVKKLGESFAKKYFGADGERGFRFGWNLRKKYLAVKEKCEKFNTLHGCVSNPTSNIPGSEVNIPGSEVAYCVVAIVNDVTGNYDECYNYSKDNTSPPETPCTFPVPLESVGSCKVP